MSYNSIYNNQSFTGDYIDVAEVDTDRITLRASTNQLTLQNTIINDNSTVARTINIPNTVSTNTDFVLTDDAGQTIGGDNTFTGINSFSNATGIKVDQISEYTADHGTTVESVNIKDNRLTNGGTYMELDPANFRIRFGLFDSTIDLKTEDGLGVMYFDRLSVDELTERTVNNGVVIDGIRLKDGVLADTAYGEGILRSNATGTVSVTGLIVDADVAAAANIQDTKLATISTAGKVSNSATTATSSNTTSAIVARDSSGNFSAGTIYANLVGTASNADNTAITLTTAGPTTYYLSFVDATSGYRTMRASSNLSYVAGTRTLTCQNIVGNCSTASSATTADNINNNNTASGTVYLCTAPYQSSQTPIGLDSNLTYNTSTQRFGSNVICPKADDADQLLISNINTAGSYYVMFTPSTISYVDANVSSSKLIFNPGGATPGTETLTCSNFIGNASTATLATSATDATNASKITLAGGGSSTNYLLFSTSQTGNQSVLTNAGITFNGTTTTLNCANINGTASNATSATNAVNVGITANSSSASTHYLCLTTNSGGGYDNMKIDSALSYVPSTDTLTCGTVSATLSGTATNASNVAITDTTSTAGTYLLTFVGASSGNNALRTDSTNLTYVPSTDTLSCINLAATSVIGNLTGTATNATNINLAAGTNATNYLVFAESATGNQPAKTKTTLTFNASTSTLATTTFSGELSGTITSATTGITQASTDNSTKIATTAFTQAVIGLAFTLPELLAQANCIIDNSSGTTQRALFGDGTSIGRSLGDVNNVSPVTFYIDSSLYPSIQGKTPKLLLESIIVTNTVTMLTGSNTITISLCRVTASGGTVAKTSYTLAAASASITLTTPSTSLVQRNAATTITIPTTGVYLFTVTCSATPASNSCANLNVKLHLVYE